MLQTNSAVAWSFGEERAVARDAAHLASRGGQGQDVTSTAGGEPPTSGAPRRLCCSQSSTTTWIAPATGIAPRAPITPASSAPISTAIEDDQRRELHRATVDERLQHVVLELLVEDEEDDEHDAGSGRVEEADRADDDGRDRRAGERDQVEDRHDEPERDRIRDAEHEEHDRRRDAGDRG